MAKRQIYIRCPECKANLDHGERCDCQKIDIQPDKIPKTAIMGVARATVSEMKRVIDPATGKFIDPEMQAKYEAWLPEYRQRQKEKAT